MAQYRSVADMLRARIERSPDQDALYFPTERGFGTYTWRDVNRRAGALASGLRALGLKDEERVAILSSTRLEWALADFAVMMAGGATTTIYPSSTADECQFILTDSGSRVVFAEDDAQVAKLVERRGELPELVAVINLTGPSGGDGWVVSLAELEKRGRERQAQHPHELGEISERLTPDRLATLIYTSGTTGRPKGVELLHDCWLYIGESLEQSGLLSSKDKQYLWLPLSHVFGKMLLVLQIHLGIPTAIDGRVDKIVENLAVVQPTFMAAAPRIFEKVYNKVINTAREGGAAKWKIFKWALGVGREASALKQRGAPLPTALSLQYKLADKLVFAKLRARFGGRLRFFVSGSAPLNRDIAEFFHAAGLLILEGYGLTESSAASFVNRPEANKFGTVGPALPGTQIRIADDGEILIKSRGIMRGYYNLPEVAAETLKDGWLHTGDIGEVDAEGHLRITDRKKDLIKTSGGKYVAPQALEGRFKAACPFVSQVLVHGDNRNYCSALITMDPEAIAQWAASNGLAGLSYEDLSKHEQVRALFQGYVNQVNSELARFETIKKFALLPRDLTVEDGELTPSLKVKRKAVEKRYAAILDGFYRESMADL